MQGGGDGKANQGSGQNQHPGVSIPSRHSHHKTMISSNNDTTPQEQAYLQIRELLKPYQNCLDIYLFNIDAGLLAVVNIEADDKRTQDLPRGVGLLVLFGEIKNPYTTPGLTLLD